MAYGFTFLFLLWVDRINPAAAFAAVAEAVAAWSSGASPTAGLASSAAAAVTSFASPN